MSRQRVCADRCVRWMCLAVALAMGCTEDVQLASDGTGVGTTCARDTDCATGLCYLGGGPGYCTAACQSEGETAGCPPSTICKPIQGTLPRCLALCGQKGVCAVEPCADDACPDGSACVQVGGSALKACEPLPVSK